MFEFAHPFYLLLSIPVLLSTWFIYRKRAVPALLFPLTDRVRKHGTTWRSHLSRLLPILVLLGLLLTVLALARPRTVLSRSVRNADVIAIEMVVDVSGSMEALDFSPKNATIATAKTRLDVVKEMFTRFVEKRPDDLIGLVTFGGYASTRVPMTADHRALLHVLKGVEIPVAEDVEETRTAIGDALATACGRLEPMDVKSRIIVLLSDGVSNTGIIKPEAAAEAARKLGFRVYTIGAGTTGEAPFRTRDIFGRETIGRGNVELDEKLLDSIAKTTGGKYFHVQDSKGLEAAMEEINALEKTEVTKEIYYSYNELFPFFLAPGLLLIVLGAGLNMLVSRRLV